LLVSPGDKIKFSVKALPGCTVVANANIPLYEMPTSELNPVPGIYQGEYDIKATDSFLLAKIPVTITDPSGKSVTRRTENKISMLGPNAPNMVVTKGRLAHLLFGLGDDRLGGAKIGYIDSLIPLRITGKAGSLYKVRLSKYRTAYVNDEEVDVLPNGNFTPESLTGNWKVYGDSLFDYVQVGYLPGCRTNLFN
jgi:N-acetylmuramoyl-L-alanine amidase